MTGTTPSENVINTQLTASIGGLLDGLKGATTAVKEATGAITSQFGTLGKAVDLVKGPLVALTAVLAGGHMFGEVITKTREWNDQAIALARTLGITTEEASVLNLALGDIFVSSETYTRAVQMMTRQIAGGGDGFKKLGVDVRSANGELRPTTEIMTDVLTKLNSLKQGTDRNAAGMSIFGKSWGDAQKLLKLTAGAMEEAKKKAESLSLIVGGDAVAANERYKAAMNDVEDVGLAIATAIGQELLPILADLADWMKDVGPGAVTTFKVAFQSLMMIIDAALIPFRVTADLLVAIAHGLSGDFTAAGEALKEIGSDVDIIQKAIDRMVASRQKATSTRMDKPGTDDANVGKDDSEEVLKGFKAELEAKKALEENWFVWTTEQDAGFWRSKLASLTEGSKAYIAVQLELNRARRQLTADANEEEVTYGRLEMQRAGDDLQKKLRFAKLIYDTQTHLFGDQSKQQIAALREVEAVQKEIADKGKKDSFELFAPLTDAWRSSLAGMLANTQSFSQALQGIWQGLGQVLDKAIVNLASEWIGTEAKKLGIYIATRLKELAVHVATDKAKAASTVATATTQVAANAAVAGSGAAASAASIPGIGWMIAIPAALAVVAGVMALRGGIASAAGGWGTVPSDQIAQLHKNEMVLPASIADKLRRATSGAAGLVTEPLRREVAPATRQRDAAPAPEPRQRDAAPAPTTVHGDTYHVTIHATDAGSFFDAHEATIVKKIKSLVREGQLE